MSLDDDPIEVDPPADGPERARRLFRYLSGDEWLEYRTIMSVFADTFFAEFNPEDVAARLHSLDPGWSERLDLDTVSARLKSLREWGNLTVSTSVGNPSSLTDYYRRRNQYLITREGQEVHDLVEGVLSRVDEVTDVQSGRLRDIHQGLISIARFIRDGLDEVTPAELNDAIRAVFDAHEAFTTEITQFFASLNQWQSRYDLEPDDLQFFAEILVGYVSEQLDEIERTARPIARVLDEVEPSLDRLLARAAVGLAARVDDAGLADHIMIRASAGSRRDDWDHLGSWFSTPPGGRSRLDDLTGQALLAVRTLTANLTRLSGVGIGSASRRSDFIKLAHYVDAAPTVDTAHELMTAAFGLGPARHFGVLSADADDPVATTMAWADAPRADVPVSIRRRGETAMRGAPSRIRDRSKEKELLRRQRQRLFDAQKRTTVELLESAAVDGSVDGVHLSTAAFARLRDLIGRSSHHLRAGQSDRMVVDSELTCQVRRRPGTDTLIECDQGRLRLIDLDIRIGPAEETGEAHGR